MFLSRFKNREGTRLGINEVRIEWAGFRSAVALVLEIRNGSSDVVGSDLGHAICW